MTTIHSVATTAVSAMMTAELLTRVYTPCANSSTESAGGEPLAAPAPAGDA
jgi:hypothetical protein